MRIIMLDYEIFKGIVRENFLKYMPEEYRNASVDVREVTKVNRTLDALTVVQGMIPKCSRRYM